MKQEILADTHVRAKAINISPELQAQFQREDLELTLFDGLKG